VPFFIAVDHLFWMQSASMFASKTFYVPGLQSRENVTVPAYFLSIGAQVDNKKW
jgi:hypothetical protein